MALTQAQLEASSGANKEEQQQLQSPNDIRQWLQRKHVLLLDKFIAEIGSSASASRGGHGHSQNRWKVVVGTVNVVRHLIGSSHWTTAAELLLLLKDIGRELPDSDPAIGNAVRRIMAAVREETEGDQQKKDGEAQYQHQQQQQQQHQQNRQSSLSLETMLWSLPQHVRSKPPQRSSRNLRQESLASESEFCTSNDGNNNNHDHPNKRSNSSSIAFPADYYTNRPNLKMSVQEAIQEILSDLEDMRKNINDQVGLHLHQGEVILTCGHSRTIAEFLKATKHKVTVIVCGGDRAMAASLQKAQHTVYHIEYAAVVAVLSRVHKVLLPAYAVLANGGLVSDAGANLVALAAQAQSIPTICVTGIYKLCPRYPHEGQGTLQDWIVPLDPARGTVQPVHDYIAPHLVSLYITNVGSFPPSFIYRLLAENYRNDDWGAF